jgi:hypothetical protein
MNLSDLSPPELLALHAKVSEELRSRGVTRSSNNPVGDYAEYLFCRAYGWKQENNSASSFDAIDQDTKLKYQIKSRRLTETNTSRQMSALRNLDSKGFDYLAGILFDKSYKIYRAAIIPHAVVLQQSKYGTHTNSWRFFLRDSVWSEQGVVDVTERLVSAAQ